MKRLISLLTALLLMTAAFPAFAATPKPISKIPYDQLPENRDGLHHYLLLCMDQWNGGLRDNADGIVILTLDTRANRIMLTSVIRDALVERPDGVVGRINYIVKNYGPEALCNILSTHLGIKLEKYILFNFQQIANIVDYLGGVTLDVTAKEANYLRKYPLSPTQTTPSMNREGTYLFTGRAAVIYMRMRKNLGDEGTDFMRTQRVRNVLSVLADKCRVMTYDQARALVDSISENTTKTNMSLQEMVQAMEYAFSLRSCVIEELRIPRSPSTEEEKDPHYQARFWPITYAGMSVQEIDWALCREDMADFLECGWLVIESAEESDEDFYD